MLNHHIFSRGTEHSKNSNSLGFRSPEFEPNGILFLGCSFTYGLGVEQSQTFAALVSSVLNLPLCNCGTPGEGSDRAVSYASVYSSLAPVYIIHLDLFENRRTWFLDTGVITASARCVWGVERNDANLVDICTSEPDTELHTLRNRLACEAIAARVGARYLHYDRAWYETHIGACDNHPSAWDHMRIARRIISDIRAEEH
jgi:hypothetical protein